MIIKPYIQLTRLDKPIGITLLLWPTLWALWIASNGLPSLKLLTIFIAGTLIMRSAGCVINDIADRHFDQHVKRTAKRPLATGQLSVKAAVWVLIGLLCCALALVLLLNTYTIMLAVIAVMVAMTYPFCKRFTQLPQLVLGVAFAFGVLMAFTAVQNSLPFIAWGLFAIAVLWPIAYDTLYAMVDREDDLKIGIKSTAILFGVYDRLIIGLLQGLIIAMLILLGLYLNFHWPYFIGVTLAGGLCMYQQKLIKDRLPQACFKAFLNNHYVGMIVFIGMVFGL